MEIFKEFKFEAAHSLPNVPAGHPCAKIHGHSWRATVHIEGPVDSTMGWVVDFADIKTAFEPLMKQLDHNYMNEIPGLENPTSEILAMWIWDHLQVPLRV